MSNELKIINDENYQKWICEIKELVHVSQLKAAVQVNTEMIWLILFIGLICLMDIIHKIQEICP